MPPPLSRRRRAGVPAVAVDAAMAVARALVAISVESMGAVEDVVTLQQLRVLVVVQAREPLNLGAVADLVGVHLSNASRTCERLVSLSLLERTEDPADRRNVQLRLTPAGADLLAAVLDRRRDLVTGLLSRLDRDQIASLTPPLVALAGAAGDVTGVDEWTQLWDG